MNSGIVNKEIIEIEVADKKQADDIRSEISELASTQIPVIIDEVASKYFGNDDLIRIDNLEIDLGTLGSDNLEREFLECFRKRFEEEILKYKSVEHGYISPAGKISMIESDFELLTFFIDTGSLPWWVANKDDVGIDEILERVIKKDRERLIKFLIGIVSNKRSVSRIVTQFSASSINSLNLLLKSSFDSFDYFHNYIHNFFTGELKQLISKTRFERILFEFLISKLLNGKEAKESVEFLIIDFIELLAVSNFIAVSNVRILFNKIITSEPFAGKPVIEEIKELIYKYFTHSDYEIRRDLFLFVEQLKDLLIGKTVKDELPEDFKQPDSFGKEFLSQPVSAEDKEIISAQTGQPSLREKEKRELFVTKESEETGLEKTDEFGKKISKIKKPGDEKSTPIKEEPYSNIEKEPADKSKEKPKTTYRVEKETILVEDKSIQKEKTEVHGSESKVKIRKAVDEKSKTKMIGKDEDEYLQIQKAQQTQLTKIYVENSGLVLLAAFLPKYFGNLGLIENDKFKNNKAVERGVHLLQYLVTGKVKSPEYVLALNKILCGMDLNYPVAKSVRISKREKEESINLLQSIIKNWSVLKSTSVEGFRKSFLIRYGIITIEENQYNLKVERKSYDVLLDHLPWSISIIKHNWMDKPVYVEW